jgi:hypothetical protein
VLSDYARGGGRFGLFVRVIAGADHRARLNVAKAEAQRGFSQVVEFLRSVEAGDWQVVA